MIMIHTLDTSNLNYHVQEHNGNDWVTVAAFWRLCDAECFVRCDEERAGREIYRIADLLATDEERVILK